MKKKNNDNQFLESIRTQTFPRTSAIKAGEFFSETLPLNVAIPVGDHSNVYVEERPTF